MSPHDSDPIVYDERLEAAIAAIIPHLQSEYSFSRRSIALLMLQRDQDTATLVRHNEGPRYSQIEGIVNETAGTYAHPLSYVIRLRLQREASRISAACVSQGRVPPLPFREKLSRLLINPVTGIPVLIVIIYVALYQFVGVLGAGILVDAIEEDLFGKHINPFFIELARDHIQWQSLRDLLVGDYGILTMGITYAVAIILPIVCTFFFVFAVIEDSGYLPRLSLLVDGIFKRIGLSGRAVIPLVLGLGCDTMATMVTRTQETVRERIIATLLLALAIPCAAQLGVILGVMSGHPRALAVWIGAVLASFLLIGFLAAKVMPGTRPSFYMELPPLRFPRLSNVLTKTVTRMIWYFKEVMPIFIGVSVLVWLLDLTGAMDAIRSVIEPLVGFIGLPDETADVFLFGFFRRDYGAAGLFSIQDTLTGIQLAVAAVTLTLFVPCIAQFVMMIRERGVPAALAILGFVVAYAFLVGFLLNKILTASGVNL